MKDNGVDKIRVPWRIESMDTHTTHASNNYTAPADIYYGYTISHTRRFSPAGVRKQKLNRMPGFKLTWHFNYSNIDVKPEAKYFTDNQAFIRNISINIINS